LTFSVISSKTTRDDHVDGGNSAPAVTVKVELLLGLREWMPDCCLRRAGSFKFRDDAMAARDVDIDGFTVVAIAARPLARV
jgi:hypothetical protein